MISDFAVFAAICVMVLVDALVGLDTDKLQVPEKFEASCWLCCLCYKDLYTISALGKKLMHVFVTLLHFYIILFTNQAINQSINQSINVFHEHAI